jgi:solute:Na+ symporter, SSS family
MNSEILPRDNFTVEYLVIGMYFIFMMFTGLAFRKFIHNFSDYFRSGCRGTWWLVGGSIFMASFSAWTFTGAAGVAYTSGITVAVIFLANTAGYLINWLITAPLFRQMRATTFPEVIGERFDPLTAQFYVWISVIPGLLMSALTLLGVAVFTSAIFGFNINVLIIVLGIIVILYSLVAGTWSVMATDFLQALILLPMALLITVLSLQLVGGVSGLLEMLRERQLDNMLSLVDSSPGSKFSPSWAAAMVLFVLITYNSMGSALKYFSCKDGREARWAAGLAGLLMLLGAVLWFIPPMVARLQFSHLIESGQITENISQPAEASYAIIALQVLPGGLVGLIVVSMFSATITSLDTQLNQFAAMMTQDVYKPLFRMRHVSEKEMLIVGQIASVVVGVFIIFISLMMSRQSGKGLFDYMLTFGSLFGTPMVVPMFLVFFLKKTPSWSALFSVCCAAVFSFLGWRGGWSYERSVFTIFAVGAVSFALTSLFWRYCSKTYQERVAGFYRKMYTPVDFEKEIGQANDAFQLRLVGYVALAIAGFIVLLSLLPNELSGRLQILSIAGMIGVFALAMIFAPRLNQWRTSRRSGTRPDKRMNP